MTSLAQLPPLAQLAHPPGQAEAVESVREGNPFTFALSDDPAERTAMLQSIIHALADMETRFAHVSNPLRAPLTLERLFMQVAGPDADVLVQRDAMALTRALVGPSGEDARLIIVVEQPETLDDEALQIIRAMAPHFAAVQPRVQLLFCGPTEFGRSLRSLDVRDTAPPGRPAAAAPVFAAPLPPALADFASSTVRAAPAPAAPMPSLIVHTPAKTRRLARVFVAVGLGAVLIAGVIGVRAWQRDPDLLRRHGLPVSFPATLLPASTAAAAVPAHVASIVTPQAAPMTASAPAIDSTAELRREFERFLADRPDAQSLTEAGKDELFEQFLERRRSRSALRAP